MRAPLVLLVLLTVAVIASPTLTVAVVTLLCAALLLRMWVTTRCDRQAAACDEQVAPLKKELIDRLRQVPLVAGYAPGGCAGRWWKKKPGINCGDFLRAQLRRKTSHGLLAPLMFLCTAASVALFAFLAGVSVLQHPPALSSGRDRRPCLRAS